MRCRTIFSRRQHPEHEGVTFYEMVFQRGCHMQADHGGKSIGKCRMQLLEKVRERLVYRDEIRERNFAEPDDRKTGRRTVCPSGDRDQEDIAYKR